MNSSLDWGSLVMSGRAKAIGIPWSETEVKAIYELKIPVEYVREGVVTLEAYAKASARQEVPETKSLRLMKRDDLITLAKAKNIEFDADVVTRADLFLLLTPVNFDEGTPVAVANGQTE